MADFRGVMWLWVIDNGEDHLPRSKPAFHLNKLRLLTRILSVATLVTSFPKREGHHMEGPLYQQADLRDSVFNEVNADLTRRCENALDLAALTVLHAVTVLIDRSSHPDLEIFRIFEEAISILVRTPALLSNSTLSLT